MLLEHGNTVDLGPKPLAVLHCLLERPGKVVSKRHLMDTVWHEVAVTEHSLVAAINRLRQALADDPANPTCIQTVHRRGYRFIAPVSFEASGLSAAGLRGLFDGVDTRQSRRIEDLKHEVASKVLELAAELAIAHAAGVRER